MATGNSERLAKKLLVLSEKLIPKDKLGRFSQSFIKLVDLINYIYNHNKDIEVLELHISGKYLEDILENPVFQFASIRRIYAYYDTEDARQSGQGRFRSLSNKLQFSHQRDLEKELENAAAGRATSPSRSIDRPTIDNITSSSMERLYAKRPNNSDHPYPIPKRISSTFQHGFLMQNINQIDPCFICPSCKLAFHEPYQLTCGHRQCKQCVHTQNTCATCSQVIENDKVWLDRGFQKEIQHLSTISTDSEWTGSNQTPHRFTNCAICNERVDPNRVHQHNLNEMHQRNLSALCSKHLSAKYNDEIRDTMDILLNSMDVLNDELQRMKREIISPQTSITFITQKLPLINTLAQENYDRFSGMEINLNLSHQEVLLLKQQDEDARSTSFDGTFTWKIKNFQEKRNDAVSERHKSIYSPPFYSSPTGYKMCLRLFLHGISNTRGRYMSLYFVIMRGYHDAIVHWPFQFKVKFSLIDQVSLNKNESDFFWPDTTSICFHRPTTNMNIGYGISEFISLDRFKQYVRDDTVFIKAEVDFLAIRPELLLITAAEALTNDEEHVDTIDDNLASMICASDT